MILAYVIILSFNVIIIYQRVILFAYVVEIGFHECDYEQVNDIL